MPHRLLVIDDDPDLRETLLSLAARMELDFHGAADLASGLAAAKTGRFDLVLLDLRLPDGNGLSILPDLKALPDPPEVVILTGAGDPDGAELAIREGVWDFLVKPTPIKGVMLCVRRALEHRERKRAAGPIHFAGLVAKAPAMQSCLAAAAQAARSNAPLFIRGETGTGKERLAKAVHDASARATGPFVVVDCASLPEHLVASVLFGHRRGAFTGADADRSGLVKAADGGSLFLDEIGELPPALQKTFLRVLEEKRFRPVGDANEVRSDFRLIAATNRNLAAMVDRGEFRQDLYFRVRALEILLPPLRTRLEDLPELVALRLAERGGDKGVDPAALDLLAKADWPGNVRELFNTVDQALAAAGDAPMIEPMHLPAELRIKAARFALTRLGGGSAAIAECLETQSESPLPPLKEFKERMEASYLKRLKVETGGEVKAMCERSGLSRSHLYALLKKYDLGADW